VIESSLPGNVALPSHCGAPPGSPGSGKRDSPKVKESPSFRVECDGAEERTRTSTRLPGLAPESCESSGLNYSEPLLPAPSVVRSEPSWQHRPYRLAQSRTHHGRNPSAAVSGHHVQRIGSQYGVYQDPTSCRSAASSAQDSMNQPVAPPPLVDCSGLFDRLPHWAKVL
jgi:hypothetical protein